jgi:hypothetical protein
LQIYRRYGVTLARRRDHIFGGCAPVATMSPGRSVGSALMSTLASPKLLLPLQVQLGTTLVRNRKAFSSCE